MYVVVGYTQLQYTKRKELNKQQHKNIKNEQNKHLQKKIKCYLFGQFCCFAEFGSIEISGRLDMCNYNQLAYL